MYQPSPGRPTGGTTEDEHTFLDRGIMPVVNCWNTPNGWVASCPEHGEEGYQLTKGCPTCDKLGWSQITVVIPKPDNAD